jgi:CHAD domain-containing protein
VQETSIHRERELKYEADGAPDLAVLGGELLARRIFTSVYYDTPDRQLTSVGATLRRRLEHGVNLWQLKVPDGSDRLEIEAPGGPGSLPPSLEALLRAQLGSNGLVELATLKTTRSGRLVDGVAVTVDDVEVVEGQHVLARFAEIEAEAVADDADLSRVDGLLRAGGAKPADLRPKLWRVVGAAAEDPQPPRSTPARIVARFAALRRALLSADLGLRVRDDPEDVHDLRVATRRLRALLRAMRDAVDPEWAERLVTRLRELATVAGAVRDLDVMIARLEESSAELGGADVLAAAALPALLRDDRQRAFARLRDELDSNSYAELLELLAEAAQAVPLTGAPLRLKRVARREFNRLVKYERTLARHPSDDALHRLRIRGKRARYAAEVAADADASVAKKFVAAAKCFQDALGEHQDAVVAEQRIRDLVPRLPDGAAAFAAGRLVDLERARARGVRARLDEEWKRLERSGRKAWG